MFDFDDLPDSCTHPSVESRCEAGKGCKAASNASFNHEEVTERFRSGELQPLIDEYRALLLSMPLGPLDEAAKKGEPRNVGQPSEQGAQYEPVAHANGRRRLLMHGDSLTVGMPLSPCPPFPAAIASRNASLLVENAGWGGLMSMALAAPSSFNLPLPAPGEFTCDFACVLIGINDAGGICAPEAWVDTHKCGDMSVPGPMKLPPDWRERCRPSVELYERSLKDAARALVASGAKVALATPLLLGEDLSEEVPVDRKKHTRRAPFAVAREMADAVHRVALTEGCAVLPLFECALHRLRQLQRNLLVWVPSVGRARMMANWKQREEAHKAGQPIPAWTNCGTKVQQRGEFAHDFVHFNEEGAALYAALCQVWLDSELGK